MAGTLDLGTLSAKISVDTNPMETGLRRATASISNFGRTAGAEGGKAGQQMGQTFHDRMMGFAASSGTKFGSGVSSVLKATLGTEGSKTAVTFAQKFGGDAARAIEAQRGRFSAAGQQVSSAVGAGGKPGAARAGREMASSLDSGFNASGLASSLAGKFLAAWAAVGVASKISSSFSKVMDLGIQRYESIDTAKAKLTALGNSAEDVSLIMSNAMEAVKGTSFGFGDAASVAAAATAAGIKPGKDLANTLRIVANTAAVSGASIGEMGAIFNKAAASNKVQGDILNQLGDRGIPIVTFLAKELGKTSAEVYKLSEAGKIDFDTFQRALEHGMDPEAAKAMGKTLQGTIENTKAAMGRLGETVVKRFAPMVQDALGGLTGWMDDLGKKVGPALDSMVAAAQPGLEKFKAATKQASDDAGLAVTGFWDGLSGKQIDPDASASTVTRLFQNMGASIKPAADGMKEALRSISDWASNHKQELGGLADAMGEMAQKAADFAGDAGKQFADLLKWLAESGTLTVATNVVKDLAKATGNLFDILSSDHEKSKQGFQGLTDSLKQLDEDSKPVFAGIVQGMVDATDEGYKEMTGKQVGFHDDFMNGWRETVSDAQSAGHKVAETYRDVAREIGEFGQQIGHGFMEGVRGVQGAWNDVVEWCRNAKESIKNHVDEIGREIAGFGHSVMEAFREAKQQAQEKWDELWGGIKETTRPFVEGVSEVVDWFAHNIGVLFDNGRLLASLAWHALWDPVKRKADEVTAAVSETVRGWWEWIANKFEEGKNWTLSKWHQLWDPVDAKASETSAAVSETVSGWWNWLVGKFEEGKNWVSDKWGSLWNWVEEKWNLVSATVAAVVTAWWTSIANKFQEGKDWISDKWGSLWTWVSEHASYWINQAKGAIDAAMNGIRDAFQWGVDRARDIWNGLEDIAKKPVKFVVETVINHGLIDGYNNIMGKLLGDKAKKLEHVPLGFAKGGYTGNIPRDAVAGAVHGREFVFDADTTEKGGGATGMERIRQAIRRGMGGGRGGAQTATSDAQNQGPAARVRPINAASSGWGSYPGHKGLDFPAPTGTPIVNFMSGQVIGAGWDQLGTVGFGNSVMVRMSGSAMPYNTSQPGLLAIYGHMSQVAAHIGQMVNPGETLGYVGSTGNSTGPHLHFELQNSGHPFDPTPMLNGAPMPEGAGGPLASVTDLLGGIFRPILAKLDAITDTPFGRLAAAIPRRLADDMLQTLPGHSFGTVSAAPGLHLVGERGPEVIDMRGGERVRTAGQMRDEFRANTKEAPAMNVYFQPTYSDERSVRRDMEDFAFELDRRLTGVAV